MNKLLMTIGAAAVAAVMPNMAKADNPSILLNGSFESCTLRSNDTFPNADAGSRHVGLDGSRSVNNWSHSSSGAGLCASGDTPFLGGNNVSDGSIAVYLQNDGSSISQSVTVTDAGTYEVSFRYASRPNYLNGSLCVKIAGAGNSETEIGSVNCSGTTFRTAYMKVHLAAGSYTFKIEHSRGTATNSGDSIVDAVQMKRMDNLVSNGSFEDYREEDGSLTTYKTLVADKFLPEGWSWTKGSGNVGLTKPYSNNPFVQDDFPDGETVIYLQKDSSISQTFVAATTGIHKVTFRYAGRANYLKGRLHAKIDGNSLGYADCQTNIFLSICMETNLVAGTSYTLTIAQDNSQNSNANSAIDLVSVTPSDNLIFNGNFDNGSTGGSAYKSSTSAYNPHWDATGNLGLAWISNGATWTGNLPIGVYAVYIQTKSNSGDASVSQRFTVSRPGIYAFSFNHAKRHADRSDPEMRVRVYSGSDTTGDVVYEKSVSSSLAGSGGVWETSSSEIKFAEAGDYTLEFYRAGPTSQDIATILDNVCLTWSCKIPKGLIISFH